MRYYFLLQLYVTYEDGSHDIIVSDQTWKTSEGPILMDMVFYGENSYTLKGAGLESYAAIFT